MKKSVFKRGTALVLALVMCLMTFASIGVTTAFAAGEKAEVYIISFPRDGDSNYNSD